MNNVSPLISVIIPVYNAQAYLDEAIRSVLTQTYNNIEVICVDDGSTDGSRAVLATYGERITLIALEQNVGIGGARNNGIMHARGTFLAFMDADDIWTKDKLELQLAAFAADPTLDICFGHMQQFISPDASEETKRTRYCDPAPIQAYTATTALMKRASFDAVGGFDPKWKVGEFIDWLKRAKELGLTMHMMEKIVLMRRIHETNTVLTKRADYADYLRIAKAALDRKKNN